MGSGAVPGGAELSREALPIPGGSPNFGERRDGARVSLVVLHYTAMESCAAARERLCDPEAEVSAHYLISEAGECIALVPEEARAWHAGAGGWGVVRDVNSASIGIELANTGGHPFGEPQMARLEVLLAEVLDRHGLEPEAVIGHSDMAPGRKADPGPRFDWRRLARAGLSVWPGGDLPEGDPGRFAEDAAQFGYPVDLADEAGLLSVVRMRFRPWARGPTDRRDAAIVADLALRYPAGGLTEARAVIT